MEAPLRETRYRIRCRIRSLKKKLPLVLRSWFLPRPGSVGMADLRPGAGNVHSEPGRLAAPDGRVVPNQTKTNQNCDGGMSAVTGSS